jgi:SAM-dependent methyltransferase
MSSESFYVGRGVYHGVYDKALALLPMAVELRARLVRMLAPAVEPTPLRVLDLGCGTGRVGLAIRERHPDAYLAGVDFSTDMATAARRHGYRDEALATGEVAGNLKARAWASRFADGAFDVVTMNMVSYMLDPEQLADVFRQAAAKLRLGGRFVLSVLDPGFDEARFLAGLAAELDSIPTLSSADRDAVMAANAGLASRAFPYAAAQTDRFAADAGLVCADSAPVYRGQATLLAYERR